MAARFKAMASRPYTVHLRDDARHDALLLVRDGFSWMAFLFSVPWALFHRMWLVATALVMVQFGLGALMVWGGLNDVQQSVLSLTLAIAIGFAADELRRWTLTRRGYFFEDVVVADNEDHAARRFLDTRPALTSRLAALRS